jgi:hypothetical protein
MAIALEFIDFIVPIEVIRAKYPGGWEQCLKDHAASIEAPENPGSVWFDGHLFRDGAMSADNIEGIVEMWVSMGFEPEVEIDGQAHWKDFCVAEGLFGSTTLPCRWLTIDRETKSAYYTGTEPGGVVGPTYDFD